MTPVKVLIIEDDDVTALALQMSLEKYGYEILSLAGDEQSAQNKIKIYNPDIVLIDIGLKRHNGGIEIAHFIRDKMPRPFIFLTAHSEGNILSQAKKTEPYGYIVKPFEPVSLHTTIQMALYRFSQEQKRLIDISTLQSDKAHLEKLLYAKKISNEPIVEFGNGYRYDISLDETFYHEKKIKLTKKENAFIRLLVAQLGSVVGFAQATQYVWDQEGASDNSVRTLVWRLRNKLPTDIIKNTSGIGYYLEN
jgi:DNA-binding response OmpR family regulator